MKNQLLSIGILILLIITYFSGCYGPSQGIRARKLHGEYGNSVNMTEQQMNNFPHLKEAIIHNKTVEVASPSQEMDMLRGIFEYFDPQELFPDILLYQNEYYEIRIYYAD